MPEETPEWLQRKNCGFGCESEIEIPIASHP